MQLTLFPNPITQPPKPKRIATAPQGKQETSKLAAEKINGDGSAQRNRQRVLDILKTGDYTGDEISAITGLKPTNVRPRIRGLVLENLVIAVVADGKTLKRPNRDGNEEIVWRLK